MEWPPAPRCRAGVCQADSKSVLRPVTGNAEGRFVQPKLRATSVAPKGGLGVKAIKKVWGAPGGMSAGVFGLPVRAFVLGSVVWNSEETGAAVAGEIVQPVAVSVPVLMTVPKIVA